MQTALSTGSSACGRRPTRRSTPYTNHTVVVVINTIIIIVVIVQLGASGKQRFDEQKNLEGEFVLPETGETVDDSGPPPPREGEAQEEEEEEERSASRIESMPHTEPEEDLHDILIDEGCSSSSRSAEAHHHRSDAASAVDDNFSVVQEQRSLFSLEQLYGY